MKKTCFAFACVLVGSLLLVQGSSSATYDPWVDLDESGDVDIFDVVTLAGSYQTTGDPTKNVNVMNWPITTQQTVFWYETSNTVSEWYNASGFGHMHLIWRVTALSAGESVTVETWVRMYSSPTSSTSFQVASTTLTPATYTGGLSVPVPAEIFQLRIRFAEGTTAGVYLAFYLTYA